MMRDGTTFPVEGTELSRVYEFGSFDCYWTMADLRVYICARVAMLLVTCGATP